MTRSCGCAIAYCWRMWNSCVGCGVGVAITKLGVGEGVGIAAGVQREDSGGASIIGVGSGTGSRCLYIAQPPKPKNRNPMTPITTYARVLLWRFTKAYRGYPHGNFCKLQ